MLLLVRQQPLKDQEAWLGQNDLEGKKPQPLLRCRGEYLRVIADNAGKGIAAFQTLQRLPHQEISRIRIESVNGLVVVGRDACVPGEEQAVEP